MKVTHTDMMFTMTGRYWSGTYPISELPKWLSFYQRLRSDFSKQKTAYDKCIEELEQLTQQLRTQETPSLTAPL